MVERAASRASIRSLVLTYQCKIQDARAYVLLKCLEWLSSPSGAKKPGNQKPWNWKSEILKNSRGREFS